MLISKLRTIKDLKFFSRTQEPETTWQRIAWWEVRRIPYNLIVGLAGIASLIITFISAALGEHITGVPVGLPDPPLFILVWILVYGVLANGCYTAGWVVEIFVLKVRGDSAKAFGPISFTLGLIFSVLLTAAIGGFFSLLNVIQILLHISGHGMIHQSSAEELPGRNQA